MATLPPNSNPDELVESMSQLHIACTMGEEAKEVALKMFRAWAGDDDELLARMVNAKTIDDG
jgi:acetylornithine/succinyldiaminopimelate/putrescine aminotransferase